MSNANKSFRIAAAVLCVAGVHAALAQDPEPVTSIQTIPIVSTTAGFDWTHSGRDASRVSVVKLWAEPAPPPLGRPAVSINQLWDGTPIDFMTQTSPVVFEQTAFALAWINGFETLVAVDLASGLVNWTAPLPQLETDSWSSPTIDSQHRTVIVAMGYELIAVDTMSGQERWRTSLIGPVVNASPVVTGDLGPRDRVFITDYGFFSDAGRMYCINTDPFDAALNPFFPGDVVWEVEIDAFTSGNSPAYDNGTVFVSTAGDGFSGGHVRAYDATAQSLPAPIWSFDNVTSTGFFGGVSVRDGAVYAASFAFSGTQLNSNIVKLHATTGALLWSAASNRSSSIPVPLADGRVVLSGGIMPDPMFGDFGSRPSIAVYSTSGQLLLETALDTWTDSNLNGVIDPGEALLTGGWAHQPVVIESGSGHAEVICRALEFNGAGSLGLARLNLDSGSGGSLMMQSSPTGSGPPVSGGGWLLSIDLGGLTIRKPRLLKATP